MITRPLDLASKMRPQPHVLDWLFFVNAGLLVLFFSLFGSRFVLAPGLPVSFRLPEIAGAASHARTTTHVITVTNSGQVLTSDGVRQIAELTQWLGEHRKGESAPSLLVRASADAPLVMLTEIASAADRAGFAVLLAADEPARRSGSTKDR